MATKQPDVSPKEALAEAKKDAPRAGNPDPTFDRTPRPAEGGSYVLEGGNLRRVAYTKQADVPIDEDARKRDAAEAAARNK